MALKLMGKKRGMTKLFDDTGKVIVCTVIEVEPNVVTQIKTIEKDGYSAVQSGFEIVQVKNEKTLAKRAGKPLLGHFKKSGVAPRRYLAETRVENTDAFSVGQEFSVAELQDTTFVDICATSKGKGYQGVMKKYNFAGGPAAHGSGFHRHAGSTGMRSTPGRCLPNGPRASHMGLERKTVQNLRVVKIDADNNLLVVAGAVPGSRNALVTVSKAVKKTEAKKKK
jgi:large subunit ribosomal protein L3